MRIPFTQLELKLAPRRTTTSQTPAPAPDTAIAPSNAAADIKKELADSIDSQTVSAGRSSIPEDYTSIYDVLMGEMSLVNPEFQLEAIRAIEWLAKYNPDLSYALDNIVQLSNTPYDIYFNDGIPDEQVMAMKASLNRAEKQWYAYSGGMNCLRNDLLAQIAISGCLSAEVVPNGNLDGVQKLVLVASRNVRFAYDPAIDEYQPYQQITKVGNKSVKGGVSGLNKLNILTYKYFALRRFTESPYGIPPFLAALDSIAIEKDMMVNFRHVIKKLGVLGFLSVMMKMPIKGQNMTDQQYADQCRTFLMDAGNEVEKGLGKGYLIGFEGQHTFNMESITTNVAGAKDLFRLNSEMKIAGLKQDPLMLGRNYSTTETVGRVILAKLSAQLQNYQILIDKFMSEAMFMHLALQGYTNLEYVTVESKKPLISDETREQEAFSAKIANADSLYNNGTISQIQRAQMLGYDKPDQDDPRVPPGQAPAPGSSGPATAPPGIDTSSTEPTAAGTTAYSRDGMLLAAMQLYMHTPEFDYGSRAGHTYTDLQQFGWGKDIEKFFSEYLRDIKTNYSKAVKKVSKKVGEELAKLGNGVGISQVQDSVLYHVFTTWKGAFSEPNKAYINKWIKDSYRFFRQDTAPLVGMAEPPKAAFNLLDARAIEYYQNSDSLYLGKFITDVDTKKAVTQWIKEQYLDNGLPINDPEGVADFIEKFGDVLDLEDWKIDRIISTTVNKMRVTAAASYMNQAGVTQFKVLGITDKYQCPYCASMNGRIFDLGPYMNQLNNLTNSNPEYVRADTPFITAVYKKPEDMQHLSNQAIQATGIGLPSYHGSCRCTVIAVL